MPRQKATIVLLLKKYTDIDPEFIDTFLGDYKVPTTEEEQYEFNILDESVSTYLDIKLSTLRARLQNKYSKKKLYYEKVDYVRVYKDKSKRTVSYLLSYPCFERICMNGDNEKSEVVRLYFSKLREFLTDKAKLVKQALDNKTEQLKKYSSFETIYFFAADVGKYKIGKSAGILTRISNYNVGRVEEVDLKYLALVKNRKLIEDCLKLELKPFEVFEGKEIFEVEPEHIEKVINDCYCKSVSLKEHKELQSEVTELFGFYSYVKDKTRIKPFVVISK